LRRLLPEAQIILSTWARSETDGLEYDELILNEDPGAPVQPWDPRYLFNLNRQIVSTLAGLRRASRRYAMKIRGDMVLLDTSFLQHYLRYPARHPEYAVFRRRLICPTLYSTNPERSAEIFKVSDFFAFGETADVLDLWDIPLAPEPETSRYFDLHPERRWHDDPIWNRFTPEQYIWIHCLRKHFPISFRDGHDFSEEAIRVAILSAVNNFVFLEMDQIRLHAPRHHVPKAAWSACFTHVEWLALYRAYCDPHYPVPIDCGKFLKLSVRILLRLREKLTGRPSGVQLPATARV
jgi:hypothetical protein